MTIRSLDEAEDVVVAADRNRQIYWYDVPDALASSGVSKVGLVELTAGDELRAAKRAGGDQARLAFELTMESVRRVNDGSVNTGDGSSEAFWNSRTSGMSRVRQLIMGAYTEVHNPTKDDAIAFLKSRRITVG